MKVVAIILCHLLPSKHKCYPFCSANYADTTAFGMHGAAAVHTGMVTIMLCVLYSQVEFWLRKCVDLLFDDEIVYTITHDSVLYKGDLRRRIITKLHCRSQRISASFFFVHSVN